MTASTLLDATAPLRAAILALDDVATAAGAQPDPTEGLRLLIETRRLIKDLQLVERTLELDLATKLPRGRGERLTVEGLGQFRARPERREVRWEHRGIAMLATQRLREAGAGGTPELLAAELVELAGISYWRTTKLQAVVGIDVDDDTDREPLRTFTQGPLRVEVM